MIYLSQELGSPRLLILAMIYAGMSFILNILMLWCNRRNQRDWL